MLAWIEPVSAFTIISASLYKAASSEAKFIKQNNRNKKCYGYCNTAVSVKEFFFVHNYYLISYVHGLKLKPL